MTVRREKKHRKFRGHRTYHGSHKKWRGGGSGGGRGRAGYHKHKWSYAVKYEPEHFGKRGFRIPFKKQIKVVNLDQLEKISEMEKKEEIDVTKLGFQKVLAKGKITKPLIIKAKLFSKSAIKKIEEVGGKAEVI